MARPKTPDGRRVHMNVKFSEAEAAEIDRARGIMDRSAWLRAAALAAADRQRPPAGRVDRQAQAGCPHPKARIVKGLCYACGTHVGRSG